MQYRDFFSEAYGKTGDPAFEPYIYQRRLAEEAWPDLVDVPTGMGKTAAVVLAWLWKRGWRKSKQGVDIDSDTPRRLVYCLPMRVLVEQTVANIEGWLKALEIHGKSGDGKVSVNVLMGGEEDIRKAEWASYPEENSIIVGTQDMLLSRALMRGYGISRYQWPVHFALLHNDALWVYDEVQLMGAALPTSTQLEGLRRGLSTGQPCRSLWASATLNKDWLQTVDFREYAQALKIAALTDRDRTDPGVQNRLNAPKALAPAGTRLDTENSKQKAAAYIDVLSDEIAQAHQAGRQTLVIINRVERAQSLYKALREKCPEADHLLLHARFRPRERRTIEGRLYEKPGEGGRIIVATQAVEAGVDISSHTLFTELAPWSSMVQRFGRCNRAGEYTDAQVCWIDIDGDTNEALPYTPEALSAAREQLSNLHSASASALPKVDESVERTHVLRRRDLLDLFNTDPDLSGFDVDISPYIRDPGNAQSQVFWREFDEPRSDAAAPSRDELCPVGLGQLTDYLGKKGREAWTWDPLAERWRSIDKNQLRPGLVLLLRAEAGGYLEDQGFVADAKQAVTPVESDNGVNQERYSGDSWSMIGCDVTLTEHLQDVAGEAERLAGQLELESPERDILTEAGRWHDVGKAHEAFQRGICGEDAYDKDAQWAKSKRTGIPDYHVLDERGERQKRKGFRHELASMLAWLEHGDKNEHADLIAYLIAAHHGKVRMGLRALPTEKEPPGKERLYARGVWHGDRLPAVALNGKRVPETELHLDLMKLGEGPQGPSWTERTQQLLQTHGPFRLAWLEALVRIADWRASRKEQEAANET